MAFVAADWTIAINGDIRYIGDGHGGAAPSYATVLEFHRAVQAFQDDALASGDDLTDIVSFTASSRSTNNIVTLSNGFNIDDTAAEHLYDGSITQADGGTVYSGIVVVGAVESGTEIQLIQDGALITPYWGTGLNANAAANILLRIMVKTRVNGADIDGKRIRAQARELSDRYAEFSATLGEGNATLALFTSNDLNNQTAGATIATYDQFSNTEGYQLYDITGDTVDEEYYSRWAIGGGTIPASPVIKDLYEYTKYITRRGSATTIHGMNGQLFRGITHQWPYDTESGGPFTEDETIVWGTSFNYDTETGASSWTVGEYLQIGAFVGKLLQVTDSGTTGSMIVAVEGGGTLVDNAVITQLDGGDMSALVNGSPVGNGVAGGEGVLLALDDNGTTGFMWIQLISGSVPVDNVPLSGRTSGATALVNGSATARTVSPEFIGNSTGSALIGAFGIGVDPTDVSASDQFFDLTNTLRTPPNNVTFTVNGLVASEDYVLVGPEDGSGGLDLDQFVLNGALTGAAVTAVVVGSAIPTDTPSTGTIRIELDTGLYRRVTYTSYTGSTFTIPSTDFSGANQAANGNNTFISYIDLLASASSVSFTSVFLANRTLFIRVRDGGATPIKPFETTGTLTSAGGSTTAIRTSDA